MKDGTILFKYVVVAVVTMLTLNKNNLPYATIVVVTKYYILFQIYDKVCVTSCKMFIPFFFFFNMFHLIMPDVLLSDPGMVPHCRCQLPTTYRAGRQLRWSQVHPGATQSI